jgi:Flp pilus assembly protein TadD
MFWLLSMLAFARYVESERPAGYFENFTSERYLVLAALFVCGLMAKPMLVTFPFVLLLLDFWPLERLKSWSDFPRLAAEKAPLFVLAIASAVVTFFAQKSGGAVESLNAVPLLSRIANSITAYASYVFTAVYPNDLAVLYPWRDVSLGETAASIPLLAVITALCIWQYRSRKYLLFGWLWFLGTLVPVIGLVQVGPQSLADRYTYVPYFGLFTMAVFGLSEALSGIRSRQMIASIVAGVVILIFGSLAFNQVGYWRDSESLYRHTLAVTRDNFVISHNLCHALTFLDRLDEARPLCEDAIRIKPSDPLAFNTLGIINFKRGEYADAETNFKRSIDLGSKYPLTYSNLALAKILQGRPEEGEADLKKAADITSGSVSPQFFASAVGDLANAYAAKKNYEKAAENFGRLVYIQPNNADARTRLAWSLYYLKKYDEAGAQAEKALSLAPDSAETYNIYGLILLAKGRPRDAEKAFERALKISPGLSAAKDNLAAAKSQ